VQDPDVLDTWFSSCLWPFSTLGWPDNTEDLKTFYPTSVLVTGYDIITFWVSRMIMMGLKFMKEVPFKVVNIHGLIRDIHGKKMSKSLGNVIDPINIIDRVGSDALRFALLSLMTGQGQDIKLNEEKITESRNFANKIWNASRFVLMNCEGPFKTEEISSKMLKELDFSDKWILSRFNHTVADVNSLISDYDLGTAARSIYDFLWGEFCDWYIEMSKDRMNSPDPKEKGRALSVLLHVLEGTLRLLHPFMPFITEEIWQAVKGRAPSLCKGSTIMLEAFPKEDRAFENGKCEADMDLLKPVITAIRNIRAQYNIPQSKEIEVMVLAKDASCREAIKKGERYIVRLARSSKIDALASLKVKPKQIATSVVGGLEIIVPLAGLIDVEKEKARLEKGLEKATAELAKVNAKLSNKAFMEHAKEELIEEEKQKLKDLEEARKIIEGGLSSLSA
jgi:valyl-tRNA synthetase